MKREASDLPKLASPAQRALAGAGITRLVQLTRMSEAELAQLHGIGPTRSGLFGSPCKRKGYLFRLRRRRKVRAGA